MQRIFQILTAVSLLAGVSLAAVKCPLEFAPQEGPVKPVERPLRAEICLNGFWQFQPVEIAKGWKSGTGIPPELPPPTKTGWESTSIKIPSPWNVNSIGHDRKGGGMDSRTYPSYPESWNRVEMGWLRKTVNVPSEWRGQRIFLRLEAVAGDCRLIVNGKETGFWFDPALPGEFDITDAVIAGTENEILLGIRNHSLYAKQGSYGKLTYPTGSMWLMDAVGVWQDVFLLAKPGVHVADVFLQPMLDEDLLVAQIELVNRTAAKQSVSVEVPVYEWINHTDTAKTNLLKAPEISWSLGGEALRLTAESVELNPGEKKTVVLKEPVKGRLKKWDVWTRGKPNLYAAVAEVSAGGKTIDRKFERFGWRQVKLEKGDLLLNGEKIQMMHDGWHFTGVPCMSRRYAWAWYTLAKDAHVTLVRPHAMPYPRYFYDMADEMGMLIMDESGIFGSHCDFNYDSDEFWQRNRAHVERLVHRDRNHPSIIGWSVANEIWCVLRSRAPKDYQENVYNKIFDLCKLARSLDPTRQWVQSDGDKDLNGRLDLWLIHCGSEHTDTIPPNKLWGVTEGGSSYYGKPEYYEKFVGDRAYRSFTDRLDALAKEDYNLIRTLRKQDADICNVWNLVWHAMKPIPLGLKNGSKKQLELTDGIFFKPYVEGKPGIQPERIAPFSTTVNPGYDPSLPLVDPNPLYLAMQAAMHPDGPQPCEWDHFDIPEPRPDAPAISQPVEQVSFVGNVKGTHYDNLKAIGIPFSDVQKPAKFMIADLTAVSSKADTDDLKEKTKEVIENKGTVLLIGLSPATQPVANQILPQPVVCAEDEASSLLKNLQDARTASLSYKELYFAENFSNPLISRYSLSGPFVEKGNSLLYRNNTDWRRWLSGAEHSKTISIVRSELENTQAPVLVEYIQGQGRVLVSTLELENLSDAHADLYRKLLMNLGLKLQEKQNLTIPAFNGQALVKALVLGRFGAASLEEADSTSYIEEETVRPVEGSQYKDWEWTLAANAGDRFVAHQLGQKGPEDIFACYFSYWVYCPIDLGDLLNAGPDLPKVFTRIYYSDSCKFYMNGTLLEPPAAQSVDYRMVQIYPVGLKRGWNHFLIKLASDSYAKANPGCLAVRLYSDKRAFELQLKTAVQLPE